ncbi:hypothetical protein ACH4KT_12740 [Streptomyces anulatus]
MTHPFLDLPPLTADHFAAIERRVARLLATEQDVVITQGEALLPLEGCIPVSARAWERIAANPAAPRRSYLSLLDWKERWIDGGRTALPHAPAQLEMLGLEACVARIEDEGLDTVMARHASAAAATRAGAVALGGGLEPYVHEARDAAPVATTLRAPAGTDAAALVMAALAADPALPLVAGGGALSKEMIRVNHYGADATRGAVLSSLAALGAVLTDAGRRVDIEAARRAVSETWPSL